MCNMWTQERDTDVGIICVIIYDDLALEAWTQRREREREKRKIEEAGKGEGDNRMI